MVFTPSKEVGIKPGDRVGIVGIGGLGHLGIQLAKVMVAADVLAFSRSANKEQQIRRLCANEFVVYTDEKQTVDAANSVDVRASYARTHVSDELACALVLNEFGCDAAVQ
ncbi:hypothetical protein PF010_g4959 [Phytophthora fragariae]|uniref:Alcohol dehydrogenase-like C-terminal domain-containing protein n=2 Tax=Phytophthora fragariae TaxID=53985 RepID=A0A6G0MUK3_9STRA|nr:hypothetical protein PF010_g4959 [Phytophthora fragariae]KAE9181890.1 hypothetical protein PF004_g24401 [Phytophthora fragariae]KAE9352858.1 hypothetical protein PF008_g5284 [Phytophthora fragariae]